MPDYRVSFVLDLPFEGLPHEEVRPYALVWLQHHITNFDPNLSDPISITVEELPCRHSSIG
jgi:hypothetical protein